LLDSRLMKSPFFSLGVSWLGLGLVACGSVLKADDDLASAPYKQAQLPIEQRIQDLLERMTVEEKARQLDLYSGAGTDAMEHPIKLLDHVRNHTHAAVDSKFLPDNATQLWGTLGVGAIHDLYPYPALGNEIQDWVIKHNRLGIPALFFEEGVHGSQSFEETVFPAPIGLGTTWDTDLAKQTGATIAAEMRARGIQMALGPVLDLAREPRWGRIEEDMGEDPYLTGQLGLAYVQGMQGDSLASDHNIIAEPKHFAGHGSPQGGLNTSSVHIGEREARTIMLKSFEPAIEQGKAMGVMAAYHDIDGIPCTANPWLLLTVLRQEMGFQGFVLSDLGAISRLEKTHHVAATPEDAVCLAINSGVDMQFYDYTHDVFQNAIIDGIKDGKLKPEALDRAVTCVLRAKFMLGLFDHPFTDPALDPKVARAQAHLDVSLRSSLESMCLLKNDGNLLPLSKQLEHVAVIGPNGDQARLGDYAEQGADKTYSIVDGVKASLPNAKVVFDSGEDIATAVAKARHADVIIAALGERLKISGEGFDRDNLDLPENQEALLEALVKTGKHVVLVLENGRPLSITWAAEHVPAILEAWYPGEFGGLAVGQTLFGDNNPAGRLPVSFPRTVGDIPDYYNHESSERTNHYVEGPSQPLFTFGTGLSYTTFKYDQLAVTAPAAGSKDDVKITASVTNTGTRAGDEVAQLYVREETADVVTPVEQLKGFARLHLKPGESKTVTLDVPQSELAVWNANKQWAVEPGDFAIRVGGSLEGALKGQFTIQ
jgi:beta-glucosidase